MSPRSRPPLFVLVRTSESLSRATNALLVWRSHPGLRSHAPDLCGLHQTRLGGNEVIRCHRPLLCFASRSESYSSVLTLLIVHAPTRRSSHVLRRASYPGVHGSSTLSEADSDLQSAYLTDLCCAFRLSQPLGALFHPRPFRPCFVSVTPLNFHLQRLSLSGPG